MHLLIDELKNDEAISQRMFSVLLTLSDSKTPSKLYFGGYNQELIDKSILNAASA